MHCTKILPEFEFGVKGQDHQGQKTTVWHFLEAVLAGTVLRALHVLSAWENIFSTAGMAGVAVGHATASVSK